MSEANLRKCKTCSIVKHRIMVGKYGNGDTRWVDNRGKLWSGNVCPLCNKRRSKENMRKYRAKPKTPQGPGTDGNV